MRVVPELPLLWLTNAWGHYKPILCSRIWNIAERNLRKEPLSTLGDTLHVEAVPDRTEWNANVIIYI